MKILFSSYVFQPSIGGIENVGLALAKRMQKRGHEVVVMTKTPGQDIVENIPVVRNPEKRQIRQLYRESDAVFGNHLSLGLLMPLITRPRKPHCILLHTHLQKSIHHRILSSVILSRNKTFAVSNFLASEHGIEGKVIYNGYNAEIFNNHSPEKSRQFDFLYVGRIVDDKGVDMLVDAMNLLPSNYNCLVVGDGPDKNELKKRAPENMKFLGHLKSLEIAELMRKTKWVIIPSRWKEPFGLVAIEAIACGANVLASNHGGLPEAVGPCGILFEPNSIHSLSQNMSNAIENQSFFRFNEKERMNHLAQFCYTKQLDSILEILHQN